MQTAPCPHCGTPNFTNLVVCYYCGRHLSIITEAIPDDLSDYNTDNTTSAEEIAPPIVGAISGFAASFVALILIVFVPFGLLAVALNLNVVIFVFLAYVFFNLCLYSAGFIPLVFQLFWNLGATHGPRLWLKWKHWCEAVKLHFQKVRAGEI